MGSHIQQAVSVLRDDGLGPLLTDTVAYLRRESSRTYSEHRYSPEAPTCRVMEEDWDNLVVLDACRFDQFERLWDLGGRLDARTSLGSCTAEFLEENFDGETHHDTVYVTSNPMYRTAGMDGVFHDVIDVWESDWDEDNQTVRPEEMVAATLDAYDRYPDKRILSHFVQPHYPFIGENGDVLAARASDELSGIEWIARRGEGEATKADRATPWDLLDRGILDEETVRTAYDENLRLALPHVETLLDAFDEKTVVTSDHGNLLGAPIAPFSGPTYGHPPDTYVDGLRKVPWLTVDGERRKDLRAEAPGQTDRDASSVVSDRLADLGYAES